MGFESNEVINGLYGNLFDELGMEVQGTQEFEAVVELDKATVKQAGVFLDGNKVVGGKGKGKFKKLKIDSRLQVKQVANPTAKYNYLAKLADPTARGEEAVLLIGVSFDKIPLSTWKLKELVEQDYEFTFDNFRYVATIN
jgi:hypothetical protein